MSGNSTIKGIEQERAKFAYKKALNASREPGRVPKEYKSYAKKFPMLIKTNGLGAALAFAFSKKKSGNAWELLFNDIQDWLKQDHKKWLLGEYIEESLEIAVISLQSNEYRAITVETLAFLTWLRRFAEGLIEGEADN